MVFLTVFEEIYMGEGADTIEDIGPIVFDNKDEDECATKYDKCSPKADLPGKEDL